MGRKRGPRHNVNKRQRMDRKERIKRAREMRAAGASNEEIGSELGVSRWTVQKYVSALNEIDTRDTWRGGELPELDDDDKPRIEDFVWCSSGISKAQEMLPDVTGIDASACNRIATKAMKKTGIPTMDPREKLSRVIAP